MEKQFPCRRLSAGEQLQVEKGRGQRLRPVGKRGRLMVAGKERGEGKINLIHHPLGKSLHS